MTKRLVNISCSLCRLQLLTDFFYFWYVGSWHHKEEPYRFWCRSDNFSPIYSLKLSIFMTERLVNISCSLYRLQLLIDFFYFWYVVQWHHKEEPYQFWCRSDNISPIYSLNLYIFMTKRLVNISFSLYRLQLLADFFYFWYVGSWHHKEEPYRIICGITKRNPIG